MLFFFGFVIEHSVKYSIKILIELYLHFVLTKTVEEDFNFSGLVSLIL